MSNFGNVPDDADQPDPPLTPSTARAIETQDQLEHSRLKKMMRFMRKKDELDEALYTSVEILLGTVPSAESTAFGLDDVADMIHSFPPTCTSRFGFCCS